MNETLEQTELKYYKEQLEECRAVIKQLTNYHLVEGQPIYIHPFDVWEMFTGNSQVELTQGVDFYKDRNEFVIKRPEFQDLVYKQSIEIPARTKNIV